MAEGVRLADLPEEAPAHADVDGAAKEVRVNVKNHELFFVPRVSKRPHGGNLTKCLSA